MVFESVLTQVLNSVLGDYVENLDRNQLNVGIWGGDVELKNLVLKQSALDELDLPVQTVYGRIGKLVLKIPWKNLYNSEFVINVEDIYLLAQPNQQVKYDPIKEDKKSFEAKQKEIQKVEDAKKAEAAKDKPKADFTFVEKLITQIIKNVQLNIKNIHIRYEDKVTHPGKTFALGVTLSELKVVSTDENWKPAITQENISKIFKIVQLEGLAVYWNCNTTTYDNLPHVDLIHKMQTDIATKSAVPIGYCYILGPINASARLRMNQKPELDAQPFTIPKIHLNLDMEKLFIGISKAQYRDIIALADSMDRMSKGTPYRKYRPNVEGYKGNYRAWWQFAYTCVLEGEVRRRRRNWNWENILNHRQMCKEYRVLYQKKLQNAIKGNDTQRLNECEKALDLTNIVIIRQRIELETERLAKTQQTAEKKGWFGWMWGANASKEQDSIEKSTDLLKQFEEAMTQEEKSRLFKAIDYQENAAPAQFPEAYIDNTCIFVLRTLEVELRDDDHDVPRILFTELKGVKCRLETRAAANALNVNVKIDDFSTYGLQQDGVYPEIITSEIHNSDQGLLTVKFETNPLDKTCDQRVHVMAMPLTIVYDAQTINKIVDVFTVPQNTSLDQISAAAGNSLNNMKEMTATGLQHAIEKHTRLDLDVTLHAPIVIIPYEGRYTGGENILVANLGNVHVYTVDRSRSEMVNVRKLHGEGMEQEEIMKELIQRSYDQFKLDLTDLQILMAQSDENWKDYIKQSTNISPMHILNPITLNLTYSKCLITDDPRLPLSKITCKLPSIQLNLTDARLFLLIALGTSIPLPKSEDIGEPRPLKRDATGGSSMMLLKYLEMQENAKQTKQLLHKREDESRKDFVQFTTIDVNFVMSELSVILTHQDTITSPKTDLATVKVRSLQCDLIQQTYNTRVSLQLGDISVQQRRNEEVIDIISTPSSVEVIKVEFTQVDIKSPELHSLYKSCEARLILEFGQLNVVLHQEGLLALIQFSKECQEQFVSMTDMVKSGDRVGSTTSGGLKRRLSTISESVTMLTEKKKRKNVPVLVETIKFKLNAKLKELVVEFATDSSRISSCAIRGINADVIVKEPYTQINANLQDLAIIDLNPKTVHNLILRGIDGETLSAQIVMNNLDENSEKPDIVVKAKLGGLRIVFLNWFVSNMLNFLNQFQAAQEKIIEASQAAAQVAKENMKDAYEKATKISLEINLKAPDIIVPTDSSSYDAILLDLGFISLSNRFITLSIKKEGREERRAVIDELEMSLSELKIARVRLSKSNDIERESKLLEPVNFTLKINRNLSSSWYNAVPDLDISGKIKTIKLLLSQADYQMIMSVLSGNLSEGQQDKQIKIEDSTVSKSNITTTVTSRMEMGSLKPSIDEYASKKHDFLKFNFTMDELIISLYTGGVKLLCSDSPTHQSSSQLGRFSLEGLSVKGRIQSDNLIITSVLLVNCLLDDMRQGREDKLNRLIERSQNDDLSVSSTSVESITPRSMIDVTFKMQNDDMFADVRVYSFKLILSVEYLMKIAEFFGGDAKPTPAQVTASSGAKKITAAPVQPQKETQITLNLKVEKPDIILVEHMDHINTNAMILNSEISLKLRISGAHQVINGTIKDLQLYTCNYNPAKRAETRSDILHPLTVSLAGSTPEDKGLHVELLVTDIRLSVSPDMFELLNRILVTMQSGGINQQDEQDRIFDYLNLWKPRPFEEHDYWYLKTDLALEAIESTENTVLRKKTLEEMCIISVPSIIVTIEAGVGNKTVPMILMETSLKGTAKNWSTQLVLEAVLTMQMGYYNSRLAMWEPLIEPVEVKKEQKSRFVPWELKIELAKNDQEDSYPLTSPTSESSDIQEIAPQQVVMSVDITSENTLELTVTKTCLEVLQNLGKAFSNAMKQEQDVKLVNVQSTYKVLNNVGVPITLLLEDSSFKLVDKSEVTDVFLNSGAEVPLQLKPTEVSNALVQLNKELTSNSIAKNHFLKVKVHEKDCDLTLPVVRADKRFFMLNYRGDNCGVISDVKVDEGVTVITLRSILQVYNHFNVPIEVYYMTSRGNELESITWIEPNQSVSLPLRAVYTPTNELFFGINDYSVTTTPYIWKDLQTNLTKTELLKCNPKSLETSTKPFIIKVIGEMEQVYYENTTRHTMASTCYNIHLRPAVIFKNCLPVNVVCCIEEMVKEVVVEPGDMLELPSVDPGSTAMVLRLPDYLEKEWSSRQEIVSNPDEFVVWTFNSYDSAVKMCLDLGMHTLNKNGSIYMTIYCPFWMLNKTGLMLGYRASDENMNILHHPADFKGPILFSFNAKNFFGKKKASVRIDQGDWSEKFSLDVAGSSGVVQCKANDQKYQVGVHNQLTYNGLSKQVTFTPYYVIINNAPFVIECQENDRPADQWITIESKSCAALWPKSELEDKLLRVRIQGTNEISAPFLYTESHTTLLKINNKFAGLNVDIQLTEGGVYINMAAYEDGMAPALIVNHTSKEIKFWEKESVQIRNIGPKNSLLYTWENPSGPRVLVWEREPKKEIENDLRKDGLGDYSVSDSEKVYWASFLDGMQRVLLFTEVQNVAEGAQASNLFEIIQQELTISIPGLGLSLVNNQTRQEIMYIGIASSGVIWEQCKMNSKRFKQLNQKESHHLEMAYQQYRIRRESGEENGGRSVIDNKMEVDFSAEIMFKPHKRRIRRTFQTGLWLQIKTSPSQMQLHAKINRLQIDNQMYDCTFPVVLAPVPPPKSVAADSGIKPFVELSIVQLLLKNSQIRQFKYFKVLVQEFHIKVDLGFVNAIVNLMENAEYSEDDQKQLFLTDMRLVDEALYSHASSQSLQEQKSFYDLLHFSPLKIHISFSMAAGSSSSSQNASTPNFINVLLQGLGVTLTDMQDVVFKLAYFERTYTFLTQRQLISEATSHYVGQSVKQLYVLVLGLDVLGNPYGLVLGITKGVEDLFYEPFQGAIQGPGEFAEGLVLGFKSLFGHTVGGAAGAVSRITGAMGKGIAALTFDEDYQRKRREQINKRPTTAQEGFARSGKGLVMGVVDGVTGVFTKPVSGAKEQGFEGFFKGLGKGAVGLVARPAAGVIDFASGSLDVVKRATEVSEDTLRLRSPRFLPADGLVRPFNAKEAEGNKLLIEMNKGKYASTDIYVFHHPVVEKKEILLLTDKRIAFIMHNDIFGGWQIEWSYTWQELQHPAKVVPKGVTIQVGEMKRKKLFGSNDATKTILISDPVVREEICEKIESLRGSSG